ncbi:MAG: hypothetical protein A3H72_01420 [Candidatus Doudnabacteria bacterium RIFCSPLOWO2_02_FULL_48_8]|uniref:DNA 3'-5' helicase n=1 Tax=Candidatus Doudnabacteria bacterium RIFCSPHIGHO2_01_FULL_46_24 TaxID=1817825 RepID=A0A1F5NUR4_9BACT|nr:MAG: hypothetical protein A2720_00940 [Candidatus Doudnabacteria bacterium RIFCSPHIGHO2_01_FULL_46_24]OGE95409.1 MAG: hypothetical protein A3H72_01420 [Candidatus Doudnabacteria bacterium RIFCSPLOWO2_02_FULL_48_8]OGE95460.1 MAG: hypothetical protein A3E98_01020 [Candidatus Doudnabacteria bacterium RIFCSPHIGHO2_12_FULL_48_11]
MKQALKQKTQTLEGLNQQQEKAVTFGPGPLLIIAGAGTGKTTVITRRIAWLIEQNLAKPEEILALTFTEKAANEMEERVDKLLPLGFVELQISTFHAFAQKILQQHALDIGLPGDFRILTQTQAWMLVKKHLHEFDLDYYKPFGNPNRFIHALLKHFNKAKGEEITPEDYLKHAQSLSLDNDHNDDDDRSIEISRIKEVANAYHTYQKLLLDNSYLDFGDLINFTLKLFRTRPKILKRYQAQYKYILVDEFQDTDFSQYEMVKLLAMPQNNLTVVGDDDQSIYKFRGASVSNILQFKSDFKKAQEVTLTENYRSSQNILDLAYKFIQQNNPERLESKLKIDKKLKSDKKDQGLIEVLHGSNIHEEVRLVADKINELTEAGLNLSDFAILVRANDSAEPFISELSRRGVGYIFVANRGLYRKPFILDLLAYLRLLDNHHESENLFRVLAMENFKISDADLMNITRTAKIKALSVFHVLSNARSLIRLDAPSAKKIDTVVGLIEKHTAMARSTPISELIVRILDDLGLIKELSADNAAVSEKRSMLEQFYKKVMSFEDESNDKTLRGFLENLRLELEAGDLGELSYNPDLGPEAMRLMTIHSAKGLEFKCVFVVNLVDQRFPSRERRDQIEIPSELVKEILPEGDVHLMEERRLFYVACTRAKQNLYLTWADDYGGTTNKKPSRFLIELDFAKLPEKSKPAGEVIFKNPPAITDHGSKITNQLFIPDTFSFSQINTFRNCPLEYKLRYIYQLPLPGSSHLSLGDTVHKTLYKFLSHYDRLNKQKQADLFGAKQTASEVPGLDLLKKFYEESWVDDWYPDAIEKNHARKLGWEMLETFHKRFSEQPSTIKFLEQKFKLKLGNFKFTGKIDRADLNSDNSIDIIDYKTGKIKEKLTAEDKDQLFIYQWAAQEQFKEKVRTLKYWYLKSLGDSPKFLGSSQDIEKVKVKLLQTIEQIIDAIKSNSFPKLDQKISHDCKYRDFMV